jgi:hypothetical protein
VREVVREQSARFEVGCRDDDAGLLEHLAHRRVDGRLPRLELPAQSDVVADPEPVLLATEEHLDDPGPLAQEVADADLGQQWHPSRSLNRSPGRSKDQPKRIFASS